MVKHIAAWGLLILAGTVAVVALSEPGYDARFVVVHECAPAKAAIWR